ncbi:NXPE family member 4-like [Conger conger]|uniref:NXPE family member 4-like n=1 Tax=Conger conger TaxID=82655 RepID=UPI002A5A68E6|nr:NXPE family member 4-like [Conger conger]
MKSYAGHPKAYGGDFIQARILSPKLNASASGDVTDFLNGSYRVRFRLFWPGEVQVSVRLIHSSETVKLLQRNWTQEYHKTEHTGTFISGEKNETSLCAFRLSSDRPLCEYRKKEDGEYYACYRPKTLPCDTLALTSVLFPPEYPQLTNEEAQLLDQWSSSFCQTGPFLSEDAVTRCLKGKTLYLLGDSTARQWMEYLEQKLKALDSIAAVGGGQEDVIVVIGTGQHFRPSPPEVFIRRLLNIRRAILRLQARCPQAQVFIKLENNRNHYRLMRFSNWYGYMQNLAQRKVFEDMKVAVVDPWDMTVATYSLKVHPDDFIISNQIAVALSFFCH